MKSKHASLEANLEYLKLRAILAHYPAALQEAARKEMSFIDFLSGLIEQEAVECHDRAMERRLKKARFPVTKTLEQFEWTHPTKINRQLLQGLFHLDFIDAKKNVIFCAPTGLGKTHLSIALGHRACCKGYTILFTPILEMLHSLAAAEVGHQFNQEIKKYTAPQLLIIDQMGYSSIDKRGVQLLFQVISYRYERGSIILTTNRSFKDWTGYFNNDSCLTSAILDRLLHHSETILIEGKSYRLKDKING